MKLRKISCDNLHLFFQKAFGQYFQRLIQVLVYEIFLNFEKSSRLKSQTFWLFWVHFEALFEHDTAIDFQNVFSISQLFAVVWFHSFNKRNSLIFQ